MCRVTGRSATGVHAILCGLLLSVGAIHAVGQETGDSTRAGAWRWSGLIGVTDLDADRDAPGGISILALERRWTRRVSLGIELGSGSIEAEGLCLAGSVRTKCDRSRWWPVVEVVGRLHLVGAEGSSVALHAIGGSGFQSRDLDPFLDGGLGISRGVAKHVDAGVEVRRRLGGGAGDGTVALLRIALSYF